MPRGFPEVRSREPPLSSSIVLHVPIAFPLAYTRQTQVKLLDVLVLADRLGIPVQYDPAILHNIAMLSNLYCHGRVLLGHEHRYALAPVEPRRDLVVFGLEPRSQPHRR